MVKNGVKDKSQTINPRASSGQADELAKDDRFEKIQAIHDDASGLIEEGLTFPRQGSIRSAQRREEIIKKLNEKKKSQSSSDEPISDAEKSRSEEPEVKTEAEVVPPTMEPAKEIMEETKKSENDQEKGYPNFLTKK